MALILEGGVGVAAKAGTTPELLIRSKREVAAWLLATELDLGRLVPTTVMRDVPTGIGNATRIPGSAQVLWPRFKTALDHNICAGDCGPEVTWPIAIFDTIAANHDRKTDNWGVIEELPHVVLIDHGHAFAANAIASEFAVLHQGDPIPAELLERVREFIDGREDSRLDGLLDQDELDGVFNRAQAILSAGLLSV